MKIILIETLFPWSLHRNSVNLDEALQEITAWFLYLSPFQKTHSFHLFDVFKVFFEAWNPTRKPRLFKDVQWWWKCPLNVILTVHKSKNEMKKKKWKKRRIISIMMFIHDFDGYLRNNKNLWSLRKCLFRSCSFFSIPLGDAVTRFMSSCHVSHLRFLFKCRVPFEKIRFLGRQLSPSLLLPHQTACFNSSHEAPQWFKKIIIFIASSHPRRGNDWRVRSLALFNIFHKRFFLFKNIKQTLAQKFSLSSCRQSFHNWWRKNCFHGAWIINAFW